jgi:hypothetical protein
MQKHRARKKPCVIVKRRKQFVIRNEELHKINSERFINYDRERRQEKT